MKIGLTVERRGSQVIRARTQQYWRTLNDNLFLTLEIIHTKGYYNKKKMHF